MHNLKTWESDTMRTFRPTEDIEIVCQWRKTRNGFKHEATLFLSGSECETVKVCYLNRTWERYEYQTVILKLADKSKSLTQEQKDAIRTWAAGDHTDWSRFRTTGVVAAMGEILSKDKKDVVNWKERMLKAGLPELSLPEDWNTLSDEEKESRLDKVIAQCREAGK